MGGLRWRFFDPKAAPKQKLIRLPMPNQSYCREALTLTEQTWEPTAEENDGFTYMSRRFYDHLYEVLREGAPLDIAPRQVRVQIAVLEECHRQVKLPRLPAKGWPEAERGLDEGDGR